MTLKDVLDAGSTGILAAGVWLLWARLNAVTDRLFGYLEQGAAERQVLARQIGLSQQDLHKQSAEIRAQKVK